MNEIVFDIILEEPDYESNKRICSTCQKNYKLGDEIAKSRCKHNFHLSYLDIWLCKKVTYLVCRSTINSKDIKDKRK